MSKLDINFIKTILENIDDLRFLASKKLYHHLLCLEDIGITKYKKRNYGNWNYWWYEVDITKEKINKNNFTADLTAFELTFKGWKFYQIITDPDNEFYSLSTLYLKLEDWYNDDSKQYFLDRLDYQNNKSLRKYELF